jgi:cytochrome d ubiquinol oxidase subunit II
VRWQSRSPPTWPPSTSVTTRSAAESRPSWLPIGGARLGTGTVAGLLAFAGLGVLQRDAHPLYRELIAGPGLPAVIVSGAAGVSALGLVFRRRFQLARLAAALAVAAIVAGWALAQQPQLLPGLTVDQAAAPRDTLIAVIVAVAGGGIVVIPSLLVLLRLSVAGRLGDYSADGGSVDPRNGPVRTPGLDRARAARLATACLIGGFGFLTVAEVGWAHAIGVAMLLAAIALGLAAAAPRLLEDNECDGSSRSRAREGPSGSSTTRRVRCPTGLWTLSAPVDASTRCLRAIDGHVEPAGGPS